jgi:hypothetical protein
MICARKQTYRNPCGGCIRALFKNMGFEHSIYIPSGDASWAKILWRCYATKRVGRKHENDVEEGHHQISQSVLLRRCSDDQLLPGLLTQSASHVFYSLIPFYDSQ